jgi:serine protease Do
MELRVVDSEVTGRPLNGGDLPDGDFLGDTVVVADPQTDLAVVEHTADGLRPIVFGDSDEPNIGEWVPAAGLHPSCTLALRVTADIISAEGKSGVGLSRRENMTQPGVAYRPGNLGDALLSLGRKSKILGAIAQASSEGESDRIF